MSANVHFPPLQNGLDYLQDAVHRLSGAPEPRDLKYAVLHLHGGVEVLLKYRLICHDWRLVLTDDSATATEKDYKEGNFRSIGAAEALKRLRTLDGITLTAGQRKAAGALENFRNQLQHHGLISTAAAVEAQSVKVLGFILDFIDKYITPDVHLSPADEELVRDALEDIRSKLSTIAALVDHRLERLRPALKDAPNTWCPDCGQPAVLLWSKEIPPPAAVPEHDEPRCAFCTKRWDSRQDYVDDFAGIRLGLSLYEAVHDGAEYPTEECPDCSDDMVVWFDPATGERAPGSIARCFACEAEFDDRCWRCGRPAVRPEGDEGTVCSGCWRELINED